MDYLKKTIEIEEAMEELREIPYRFPLIRELLIKKRKARNEYFARINYNLMMTGKSALKFDDIDY